MFLHSTNSSGRPLTKPTMSARRRYRLAAHPQLAHAEEVIVGGLVEVEDPEALVHQLALGVAKRDPYPVAHQCVLFPVGGGDAL